MSAKTSRSAGEFLSQYLEISGFNHENGVFMVCKEFLDNSVDACIKKNLNSSNSLRFTSLKTTIVELGISLEEKSVCITCRDTGIGIDCESVAALGEVFSSSKANDAKTGGEFGIGLKATMLFSNRDQAEPLNVKIRMNEQEVWNFGMILSGDSSTPEILNFFVQNISTTDWPWATEFSLKTSPLWDVEKEAELEAYCAAYTLWHENQLIHLKSAFGGEKLFKSYDHEQIYGYCCCDFEINKHERVAVANIQVIQELATIKIKAEVNKEENNKKNKKEEEEREEEEDKTKEIILIRSFNGMPLLPTAASACLLTNSLRFFLSKFGKYFGIEEFSSDVQVDDDQTISIDIIEKIAYRFRVQTSREPGWHRITLAIDIRSNKSLFCSFAKSHLQGEISLREATVTGFHSLFNRLQKAFPAGFQSLKDLAKQKAKDVFAPSMSSSLAGIICSSSNQEFQEAALSLLNLECLSLSSLLNHRASTSNNIITTHTAKRAKTKAAKEILQDKILDIILDKLDSVEELIPKKSRDKSACRRRRAAASPSSESSEALCSD